MKKNLIFLILCIILLTTGCKKKETHSAINNLDFIETTYIRTEELNITFNMEYTETKDFNIGFLSGLLSDDDMISYTNQLSDDIMKLDSICKPAEKEPLQIYILDNERINKSFAVNHNTYICIDDIKNNTYRMVLTQAYLGVSEPWIIYGVYGLAFLDSIDLELLKEYYNNADNMNILGLFGARFFEVWNTKEEIELARNTAISLTEYVLSNYDLDTLKNKVDSNIKQEWLTYIGVDKKYDYIYEGEFNGFAFDETDEYPIIIKTNQTTYYMTPMQFALSNTYDIETFLYYDIQGKKAIIDYLQENASDIIHKLNLDVYNNYYFHNNRAKSIRASSGYTRGNDIYLFESPFAHLHEFCHSIIPNQYISHWQYESINEYLSNIVVNINISYDTQYFFQDLKIALDMLNDPNITEIFGDPRESWEYFFDCFYSLGGNITSQETFNMRPFYDACVLVSKRYKNWYIPINYKSISETYNMRPEDMIKGDDMTYTEAISFIAYLIDNYSLEHVLKICTGEDFENAFGISYVHAKRGWERELNA